MKQRLITVCKWLSSHRNDAFTIWLLSAIVIGFVPFMLTKRAEIREKRAKAEERLHSIYFEVYYRVLEGRGLIGPSEKEWRQAAESDSGLNYFISVLDNRPYRIEEKMLPFPTKAEFAHVPLMALLLEYDSLCAQHHGTELKHPCGILYFGSVNMLRNHVLGFPKKLDPGILLSICHDLSKLPDHLLNEERTPYAAPKLESVVYAP
jgi:hypothetical protein